MKYSLIEENELFLKSDHTLWQEDAEILISYEKIFTKFLLKTKFSYQVELAKGTFRWKEENLYRSMDTIDEIITSLWLIPEAMKNYLQKQKK